MKGQLAFPFTELVNYNAHLAFLFQGAFRAYLTALLHPIPEVGSMHFPPHSPALGLL